MNKEQQMRRLLYPVSKSAQSLSKVKRQQVMWPAERLLLSSATNRVLFSVLEFVGWKSIFSVLILLFHLHGLHTCVFIITYMSTCTQYIYIYISIYTQKERYGTYDFNSLASVVNAWVYYNLNKCVLWNRILN